METINFKKLLASSWVWYIYGSHMQQPGLTLTNFATSETKQERCLGNSVEKPDSFLMVAAMHYLYYA
jgi:hypothetical protein